MESAPEKRPLLLPDIRLADYSPEFLQFLNVS